MPSDSRPADPGDGASTRTFEHIRTALRDRICLLDYPPGTMLSENRLAKEFGVSRTPIRRVLQALEFDGLVETRHGVGTLVTALDMRELKQVYALRLKLIDLIAELPAGTVEAADLATLERFHQRALSLRDGDRQPRGLAELYQDFNRELSRIIGNRPLREIADRYYYQTSRVWLQLLPEMDWRQEAEVIAEEIREVIEALRARDLRRLSEARRHHFQWCLRRMNAVLAGQDLVEAVLTGGPSADGDTSRAHVGPGATAVSPASEGGDNPTRDD